MRGQSGSPNCVLSAAILEAVWSIVGGWSAGACTQCTPAPIALRGGLVGLDSSIR